MRLTSVVLLVGVCACNQLFDLQAADGTGGFVDSDGDGVPDSDDNCPSVANPDQLDTDRDRRGDACDDCPTSAPTRDIDGDGIDDACDRCALGPPADDDGDDLEDACDLCPMSEAAEQLDTDGDLLGDACDPVPGSFNVRVFLDPLTPPFANWTGIENWTVGSDGSSLVAMAPTSALSRKLVDLIDAFEFRVELPPSGDATIGYGFDGNLDCELVCVAGSCVLNVQNFEASVPFSMQRGTLLRLPRLRATLSSECGAYIPGFEGIVTTPQSNAGPGTTLTISATAGVRIFGVDGAL